MGLREVLTEELRDLYSAEKQLVKALPKIAKGVESDELRELITNHLEETKGHVERIAEACEILGEKPTGKACKGMQGLIEEGNEALEEDQEGPSFDVGICGGALRVEHYEIAGYSACIAIANALGLSDIADLLTETLNEEQAAADKITAAAESMMQEAAGQGDEEEEDEGAEEDQEEEEESSPSSARKSPAKKKSAARKGRR